MAEKTKEAEGISVKARPRGGGGSARPQLARLARAVAASAAVGAIVGLVVVSVERALLWPPPAEGGSVESLRVLFSGLVGGLITVAVFSLWMRTVVAGLVSDQLSPRMLVTFLDDAFQRRLLAGIAGALVAVAILLLGLPEGEEEPVPLASAAAGLVIVLVALSSVFLAIQDAIRTLSPLEILSRLSRQALEVLQRQPGPGDSVAAGRPPEGAVSVQKPEMGWVSAVDADALLRALPPQGTLHVHVRVGEFVTPRTELARVSSGDRGEADIEAIRGGIRIARTRDRERDLAFAMGHLVDVAAYALTGGGKDTATAYEALVYLGAVLEAVVERGLSPSHRADSEGRHVFDAGAWLAADHVRVCAERLRAAASREPDTARHLLQVFEKTRAAASANGDERVVAEIRQQTQALMSLVDAEGMPPRDRAVLERAAKEAVGDA